MPERSGIIYASSERFFPSDSVVHGFLGRVGGVGGVSPAPFSSLNLGGRVGDDPENVRKNKEAVAAAFGFAADMLVTPRQVHGDGVAVVEGAGDEAVEADGAVTAVKGLAIGVLTADCVPILLFDPVKRAVGVVHAGWKGTLKGVASRTVEAMESGFGSRPGDILAAIGPCIGVCCYRVGEEVASEFERVLGIGTEYVVREGGEGGEGKASSVDLGGANTAKLLSAGLLEENVTNESACTSCRNDIFFSYRKDAAVTGRQLSFIMLKE
ncbi:MAG: peptidoglycan editing factor PgeF [Thermodesulfobacteriota bacterium]